MKLTKKEKELVKTAINKAIYDVEQTMKCWKIGKRKQMAILATMYSTIDNILLF